VWTVQQKLAHSTAECNEAKKQLHIVCADAESAQKRAAFYRTEFDATSGHALKPTPSTPVSVASVPSPAHKAPGSVQSAVGNGTRSELKLRFFHNARASVGTGLLPRVMTALSAALKVHNPGQTLPVSILMPPPVSAPAIAAASAQSQAPAGDPHCPWIVFFMECNDRVVECQHELLKALAAIPCADPLPFAFSSVSCVPSDFHRARM
jgi:hypothetical protein